MTFKIMVITDKSIYYDDTVGSFFLDNGILFLVENKKE